MTNRTQIEAESTASFIPFSRFMAETLLPTDENRQINPIGIILYDGKNRMVLVGSRPNSKQEETILVIEKDTHEGKSGLALFMYPDTDQTKDPIDSVTGLRVFANRLNQELTGTRYPLQTQALRSLDWGLRNNELNFGGIDVRETLFRTSVIAHARLAERLKNPQYKDFLKSHLPVFGAPNWVYLLRQLLMKVGIKNRSLQPKIEQSINRLLLGEQIPENQLLSEPPKKDEKNNFLLKLKTSAARDIWHTVGNDYQDDGHGRRSSFTFDIVKFIEKAKSLAEIEDALVSLQRLKASQSFKRCYMYYSLDCNSQVQWKDGYSAYKRTGSELIEFLEVIILEKKKQLLD